MAGLAPQANDRGWPPLRLGGAGDDGEQASQEQASGQGGQGGNVNEVPPWVSGGGWQPWGSAYDAQGGYGDGYGVGAGGEEGAPNGNRKGGGKGKGGKGGRRRKGGWGGGSWGGTGPGKEEAEGDEGAWNGWEGGWAEGSWWGGGASSRRARGAGGYGGQAWSSPSANELLGEWLDAQDNDVTVVSGPDRRGPLSARLARRGGREQILSVRREPESGNWACGNAVLDKAASSTNVLVWAAYDARRRAWDGRRSVWRRKEAAEDADPEDLLPWLLKPVSLPGYGKGGEKGKSHSKDLKEAKGAKAVKDGAAAGAPPPSKPRRRNWSSISMDSDIGDVFVGSIPEKDGEQEDDDNEEQGQGKEPEASESKENCAVEEEYTSHATKIPVSFEADNVAADAARVSALLDARQVLGAASNHQEIFSYLLIDHDLVRREGEDPMVPSLDSPLWERLPDVPRRNVLHRLSHFHSGSYVAGSCVAEFPSGSWGEVHVGRHRFRVAQPDIQALLRRCTLPEDEAAARATAMARIFSLYRTLENPLLPEDQRSSHQLSPWSPAFKAAKDIEYELFASPFNAKVDNGKYASRFPHVEQLFGSAGKYPDVIDLWPETAVVAVNPPFSDAYLDSVVGSSLERIVGRFKRVHLFVPVREAPWRSQLRRLGGASFVQDFWDSTALRERHLEQPVLYWQGSELAAAGP